MTFLLNIIHMQKCGSLIRKSASVTTTTTTAAKATRKNLDYTVYTLTNTAKRHKSRAKRKEKRNCS